MLRTRTNFILFALVVWCIGLFSLYGGISVFFNIEDSIERGFILTNYSNPLIKYSPSLSIIFAGFAFIVMPVLVKKNLLTIGTAYYEGNKYIKAKSNLTLVIIFLPSVLFIVFSAYFSHAIVGNYLLFIALIVVGIYCPISAIYGVMKHKNKT